MIKTTCVHVHLSFIVLTIYSHYTEVWAQEACLTLEIQGEMPETMNSERQHKLELTGEK